MTFDPTNVDRPAGGELPSHPDADAMLEQLLENARGMADRKLRRAAVAMTRINPNVPPELRGGQHEADEFGDFN